MQLPHIRDLPQVLPRLFAEAAARAEAAASTASSCTTRTPIPWRRFSRAPIRATDGYGGRLENRGRLPLEVLAECAAPWARISPSACRFLAEECISGGSDVDDATYFGVAFAARRHGFYFAVARRQVR
jgi:hypothetical protein